MGSGASNNGKIKEPLLTKPTGIKLRFLKAMGLTRLRPMETFLTVTIKEARNLYLSSQDTINPYAVISFKDGSHRHETATRHHTSRPSWEQAFSLPLSKDMARLEKTRRDESLVLKHGDLSVQCWSCPDAGADQHRLLGGLVLRLPDLKLALDGEEQPAEWRRLGDAPGEVLLALAWRSDADGDAGPPALLRVHAAAALFLPPTDPLSGFCDPFLRVTFLPADADDGAPPPPRPAAAAARAWAKRMSLLSRV
jgi:hypothetical protein